MTYHDLRIPLPHFYHVFEYKILPWVIVQKTHYWICLIILGKTCTCPSHSPFTFSSSIFIMSVTYQILPRPKCKRHIQGQTCTTYCNVILSFFILYITLLLMSASIMLVLWSIILWILAQITKGMKKLDTVHCEFICKLRAFSFKFTHFFLNFTFSNTS